jgi:hypothetical protein
MLYGMLQQVFINSGFWGIARTYGVDLIDTKSIYPNDPWAIAPKPHRHQYVDKSFQKVSKKSPNVPVIDVWGFFVTEITRIHDFVDDLMLTKFIGALA